MAEDIVEQAEQVIVKLKQKDTRGYNNMITTSQIRKFLTAVNAVTNKVEVYKARNAGTELLSQDLADDVKFLKVKLVYQVGKDKKLKPFQKESHLLEKIDAIGNSVKNYEKFAQYVEALVAYHKFYGGND